MEKELILDNPKGKDFKVMVEGQSEGVIIGEFDSSYLYDRNSL